MTARWVPMPFGTKSYQPRSGTQSIERLLNLYAEPTEPGGKGPFVLYGDPGLSEWVEVGDGPIRGLHRAFGQVWAVSGEELYAINETTGAATLLGAISGTQPVRMDHNATHVGIAAQPTFYAANLSGIVGVSTVSNLIGFCVQDGYGIGVEADTQNLWITQPDDLTTISGLDFTTVDAKPDLNVWCVSSQREVWVGKENTIEVFANTGAASFPFQRVAYIPYGCVSPGSVAQAGPIIWLGRDAEGALRVYQSEGYQANPVSTPAIERLIGESVSPETAEAFVYSLGGHTHYVLALADLTLIYNLTTRTWRERASYGMARWRAQAHCGTRTAQLVGNYQSGKIYELDLDTYDEDGELIQRQVTCPPLSDQPDQLFVHAIELELEAGVGLTSGQGSDPKVLLSWSDDDGVTWSSDVEAGMGAIGQRRWRASFNRLGMSRNRSFRFRISDPVKVALLGARARIEGGRL